MTLQDPTAAHESQLSSKTLTKVEHTAVAVSWSRWHAAKTYKDKPEPGQPEGQLLYDGAFDELLCQHLTPEDRQALEDRDKSRLPLLHKNMMAARTVSLDDALLRAVGGPAYTPTDKVVRKLKVTSGLPTSNIRQVGIIGAGLDARAWRLPWPQGVRLFEVDTGSVEGLKSQTFAHLPLRVAERHALVADLNDTQLLEQVLRGAGFKSTEPTVWLLEGLIGYLTKEAGSALLSKLKALSAPGSQLLVLSQPSPDRYAEFERAGIKPPHAIFELHHELLDRVRQSGWGAAEIVEARLVEEIYGLDCKQAQIHALA